MPPTLRTLGLTRVVSPGPDAPFRITPPVMELVDCVIDVDASRITEADLPPRLPGETGPRFLHLARSAGEAGPRDEARLFVAERIEDVLAPWFSEGGAATADGDDSYAAVLSRWRAVAEKEGESREFEEFRIFVRRLGETVNAQDAAHGAGFRAEVREWLTECAKPERADLRKDTFAVCLEANESCQDRVSWIYTQLKSLRLNDDIAFGLYDGRVADVVGAAREAFAKDVIEEIASRKADAIERESKRVAELEEGVGAEYPPAQRLDIYLAYMVKLGERAGIAGTGLRAMRFFDVAGVSEAEINMAWPELRARLNSTEFATYLSRRFFPWQRFMKRNFKQAFTEAKTKLQNTLEDELDRRLQQEIAAMKINPADPRGQVLADDVIRTRGPLIRDAIQDELFQEVTRRFLRANKLEKLLEPGAWESGAVAVESAGTV